jgi:hypothetical protein
MVDYGWLIAGLARQRSSLVVVVVPGKGVAATQVERWRTPTFQILEYHAFQVISLRKPRRAQKMSPSALSAGCNSWNWVRKINCPRYLDLGPSTAFYPQAGSPLINGNALPVGHANQWQEASLQSMDEVPSIFLSPAWRQVCDSSLAMR